MAEQIIPITSKSVAYTSAQTFAEYLAAKPAYYQLLRHRVAESRIAPEDQLFFVTYPLTANLLVLLTPDNPETVAVLPLLARLTAQSVHLNLRILRDDEDLFPLALLLDDEDLFHTMVDADFPLVLFFDEEWQYQEQWGPHPQAFEPLLEAWLGRHPEYENLAEDESPAAQAALAKLTDELVYEMRVWYNTKLNHTSVQEIREILAGLQDENSGEELA
jgi:hypothetical protein